jgi:hypothetical protein
MAASPAAKAPMLLLAFLVSADVQQADQQSNSGTRQSGRSKFKAGSRLAHG